MRHLRLIALAALAAVPTAAQVPAGDARVSADCSLTSTGLVPLTDLGKTKYRGQPGGLYPRGANRPPRHHLARGVAAARKLRAGSGQIVLLSIGMSNATQEFQGLMRLVDQDPSVNPRLVLVDGAQGGWDARRVAQRSSRYWANLDARLRRAQVKRNQVGAVWLKEAITGEDRPFPADARALRNNLRAIVGILQERFPRLRLVYVSSRTYGGYAITHLNPEPFAYESGFAVKWLVQEDVRGRLGRVWIGWGPYLWTDGLNGRRDGLIWACEDVQPDGTHPSPSGVRKVARLLHTFFSNDPTAAPWFTAA
jgi:hypothetical protein